MLLKKCYPQHEIYQNMLACLIQNVLGLFQVTVIPCSSKKKLSAYFAELLKLIPICTLLTILDKIFLVRYARVY